MQAHEMDKFYFENLTDNYSSLNMKNKNSNNQIESSTVIKWDFLKYESPNILPVLNIPVVKDTVSKTGIGLLGSAVASSIMLSNGVIASAESTTPTSSGIFLPLFLQHIFPLMIDVASVYVVIRIATDFYNAQRGGGKDSAGLSSVITHGKWLVFFYLIPFFVAILEEIGAKLLVGVGG